MNGGEEGDSQGSNAPEQLFDGGWEVEVPTYAVQRSEDGRTEWQDKEGQIVTINLRSAGLEGFSSENGDECNGECFERDPHKPMDWKIQEPDVVNARDVLVQRVTQVVEEFADI